jgi:hypothetical protein
VAARARADQCSNTNKENGMRKLLTAIVVAMFATVSASAFAASHGGAMKDDKKMDKMGKMDKMDKMEKKAKGEKKKKEAKKKSDKMDKMDKK